MDKIRYSTTRFICAETKHTTISWKVKDVLQYVFSYHSKCSMVAFVDGARTNRYSYSLSEGTRDDRDHPVAL